MGVVSPICIYNIYSMKTFPLSLTQHPATSTEEKTGGGAVGLTLLATLQPNAAAAGGMVATLQPSAATAGGVVATLQPSATAAGGVVATLQPSAATAGGVVAQLPLQLALVSPCTYILVYIQIGIISLISSQLFMLVESPANCLSEHHHH